jgi:hypothetical protein
MDVLPSTPVDEVWGIHLDRRAERARAATG